MANVNSILILLGIAVVFSLQLYLSLKRSSNNNPEKLDELYLKVKDDIKHAIAPNFIELSLNMNYLVDLAIDIWRLEKRIIKLLLTLPENQQKGLESSIQKLRRYLQMHDIEIVDYTEQKFNDGFNLDILSTEKDPSLAEPIIKETIEPTIIYKGQVVRRAKIIVLSK